MILRQFFRVFIIDQSAEQSVTEMMSSREDRTADLHVLGAETIKFGTFSVTLTCLPALIFTIY